MGQLKVDFAESNCLTQLEDMGRVGNGIDISVQLQTIFKAVAPEFNSKFPEIPLRHHFDMVEVCQLGRDVNYYKVFPEILLPYVSLCTLINQELRKRGIDRFLVY